MNAVLKPIELDEELFGVATGLPDPAYRSVPAASNSMLKVIAESEFPSLAKWKLDNQKETDALLFGRAFHVMNESRDAFAQVYAVVPEDAPKRPSQRQIAAKKPSAETLDAIAWWDVFEASIKGKELVERKDYDRMKAMFESIQEHAEIKEYLSERTEFEISAFSKINGVPVKSRGDALNGAGFMDWKSIDGIETARIKKAINDRRYYMQHPFYLDVFEHAGLTAQDFRFAFIDKNPPHLCRVVRLPPMVVAYGRREYQRALTMYEDCMLFDHWPGPEQVTEEIGLPNYEMKKVMEVEYV